jgi:succinoglycan biosynthesis transport protein ExoP
MELSKIARLFKRWWWLIVLGGALGAAISLITSLNVQPTYLAETKVLIGGFLANPNPSSGDIDTGAGLAETYVQLATTTPIIQGVIDQLGLPVEAADLKKSVLAGKPNDPPVITIQVYYSDPDLAVQIANTLAQQLIEKSPSNLTPAQESQIALANSQIEILNQQVQSRLEEISAIDERLANTSSQSEINPLTQQRNALIDQVNQASANMAQFSSTIANLEQQTNTLRVIEPATEAPFFRTGPGRAESAFLSALVGMVLATVAIFIIGYLDPTIRTSKDSTNLMDLTVLGTIPQLGKPSKNGLSSGQLVSGLPARSVVSEAYRALQTNLLFAAKSSSSGVYIITSPGEHEGKSLTASNLAITMAQSGLEVVLIDADLLRPSIHDMFGLENNLGLTTLLSAENVVFNEESTSEKMAFSGQLEADAGRLLNSVLQPTNVPHLRIIPGGPIVENSAQLLSSSPIQKWVDFIKSRLDVDVVLFDTAPCLTVADTSILAAKVKADCILIVQAGRTHRTAALRAQRQFEHIGINIQGIILNRVKSSDIDHGYTSGYVNINPNNVYVNGHSTTSHALPEQTVQISDN